MTTTASTPSLNIALVTGGSRGLGRAAALHLARQGFDVLLTFRTRADEASDVVSQIEALGRRALALPLDIGSTAGFAAFADQVQTALSKHFGRNDLDALVNNAGAGVHAPLAETTEAQFDQMFNIHLKGVLFLTQHLLPLLADGGRILNVSSGLARFTFPGYGAYAAMKGGIEVMTRYLAKELAPRGITVNVVAPGAVETDFGDGAVRDNAQLNAAIAAQTTLGRVGRPDDIGAAVAMLLSPGSAWITGQRIEVSGGMVL
ncbi:MAG TPA: SDR family oxidoreductase [Ideonella sp.]|uniref:SDR family NAD(P)-dependent oxidoreductase n=1 Tax=Ideonella sp. TaxID=1929293 RepID=UPI002E370F75|nr:SDR family oxidoreductase [Ideonella sp.]HEX5684315.1 SDR family oxidoreductase [Ideonella sp.]